MNAATLDALKGSIEKWEKIVKGTGKDYGTANCPLCVLFYSNVCIGCPVSAKSGKVGCVDTPYREWGKATLSQRNSVSNGRYAISSLQKIAAQAEMDFLKSLLPEDGHDN